MLDLIRLMLSLVFGLFRSRAALEAEILALRQQIIVLRRGRPGRLPFSAADKWVLGWITRLFPNARDALAVVRPETVLRWHRAGFDRTGVGSRGAERAVGGTDRGPAIDL